MTWINSDEISDFLEIAAAAPFEDNLNIQGPQEFDANLLKFTTITLHPNSGIQFNNEDAPFNAIITKHLQLRDVESTVILGLAPSDRDLSGGIGNNGDNGTPSYNPDANSGAIAGGHANDGTRGGDGKTLHRPQLMLAFGTIEGPDGPLDASQIRRLNVEINGRGIDGGNGGRGGPGGTGGNGQGGSHANSGLFSCNRGPQDGGAGGNGGRGGKGGDGADGGNGATVYLVGPGELARNASLWFIDTRGGMPGDRGRGGKMGAGGIGGRGGGPRGLCSGNGARGARGIVPEPTTLGDGKEGENYGERGNILLVDFPVGDLF
jgi:hypothetical protein